MFDFYPPINLSREELLGKIRQQMSEKRYQHSLGVEKAAIELAERYHVDIQKASLAGLLHDYAKEVPDDKFLELIDKYKLDVDLKNWNNNVWHGRVGIYLIEEDLGLTDSDILQAISIHTVGSSQMSDLAKVLYVADYIEEGRSFQGVDQAREIARQSLDNAVAYETAHTVKFLAEQAVPIYPQTLETYNAFIKYLQD
ncbi:MAG: bis(5'-nucleosyl)-tetraphosphatase (symmetrical) YqeK [Streptococcaceae bacterium]|nr:bis(5'-nucleosyl)-tetraphosphatase (symmetrical) YqeK [Streptococcaceae bacterium]MCL2681742.1 bis(5'-nucleosyl)-tetraphosphatase (symmetrical) YqeK [Streptococcaceae bacterium]